MLFESSTYSLIAVSKLGNTLIFSSQHLQDFNFQVEQSTSNDTNLDSHLQMLYLCFPEKLLAS